jgi:hypothetical protein
MRNILTRTVWVTCCVLALAVTCVTVATAADGGSSDDAQVLDVSKQVLGIEKKMDDLLGRGRWARPGQLLSDADCGYGDAAPVFSAWGDNALYSLAPQGNFAATDGWTFNRQATVVSEADPFSGAGQSLRLAKGGEAASPAWCVTLDNPTLRFFVKDVGGNGKANLKVDVLYEDFGGHVKHLTIARIRAGADWQPSVILPIYMNMLARASETGMTAVAFQFKAEGLQKDEAISVSSLYVDPYCSR